MRKLLDFAAEVFAGIVVAILLAGAGAALMWAWVQPEPSAENYGAQCVPLYSQTGLECCNG